MFEELADTGGSWCAQPQGPEESGAVSVGGGRGRGWADWGHCGWWGCLVSLLAQDRNVALPWMELASYTWWWAAESRPLVLDGFLDSGKEVTI